MVSLLETQAVLILYSVLTIVAIGIGYWIEKGLWGIFFGWVVTTLIAVFIHEVLIGIAEVFI